MDITKLVCVDSQPSTVFPIPTINPPMVSLSASTSLESMTSPLAPSITLPSIIPPPISYCSTSPILPFSSQQNCTVTSSFSPSHPNLQPPVSSHNHYQHSSQLRHPSQTSQQRVECALCGKSFSGISSHNRHVSRTHHKARPFACHQCGLQFGQKGSLDRHTAAVHLKARPFSCDHCGKGFGRKDNMKIHMTTVHLKKKPFKCDMCPKSFGGKRPLKIHRQTVHFKQRPLQCSYCDKRFGQRSNLNVHMKVHRKHTLSRSLMPLPTSPIGSTEDTSSLPLDPAVPVSSPVLFVVPYSEPRDFDTSPI